MSRQSKPLLLVLALLLGLLLTACGGNPPEPAAEEEPAAPAAEESSSESEQASQEAESSEAETEAAESEPASQEELIGVYVTGRSLVNLDPFTSVTDEEVLMLNTYETLTFYDESANPPIQPKLADSWESNEDGTEWTFTLRQGVKFHDGNEMTAEAVKYSIERSQSMELFPHLIGIASIEAVDDYTVKFTTEFPLALDLVMIGRFGGYIVSPESADKESDWFNGGNSAGTGPYMVETFESNQRVILTRFDDYWGGWEDGQVTKVSFEQVEDATVREQMLRSGDGDITYDLDFDSYVALQDVEGVRVDSIESWVTFNAFLNTLRPPFDDVKVRQALAHTFPYDVIVENTHGGFGSASTGVVPASFWKNDPGLAPLGYDLDQAKALLEEAGIEEGLEIDYVHMFNDPEGQKIGELWRAELSKVGVELNIQGVPIEGVIEMLGDPETAYHILATDWWGTYPSPYDFSAALFHSTNFMFPISFHNNPDYDSLMDEGLTNAVSDPEKADQLYADAERILLETGIVIPGVQKPGVTLVSENLKGWSNNPGYLYTVFWYDVRK
ncbi:MAG: ABC transporter substrate-binding protein [Ardenticatenaceae bacterium]